MKNKLNKLKNKLGVIVFNIMICFCMAENYVFAGGIGKTKLFTGTIQLFKDLRTPLISVATGIAIVMIIINLIRIKISDEMDSKIYTKKNQKYNNSSYTSSICSGPYTSYSFLF